MSLNLSCQRGNLSLFAPLIFIALAVFLLSGPKLALADVWKCPTTEVTTQTCYPTLDACNSVCPNTATAPCYSVSVCGWGGSATGGIENGITSKAQLLTVLNNIVTFIYEVFFIMAAMFILFSAFGFLTAAGDEEKVQSSKKKFFYALVAIVIALVSLGAATFISNTLTTTSLPSLPSKPPIGEKLNGLGGPCATNTDCGSGLICSNGICSNGGSVGSDCSSNPNICGGDLVCLNGQCVFPGQ